MALDEKTLETLTELTREGKWQELKEALEDIHPYDISDFIQGLEDPLQYQVLNHLPRRILAEVVPELPEEKQLEFIALLPPISAASLLRRIPIDERVDVLKDLPIHTRRSILKFFTKKEAELTRKLLRHPRDTAGGLMTTEAVSFKQDVKVSEAIEFLRKKARDFETVYYIYVTDDRGVLVGVLSLRDLVLASPEETLEDIMTPEVIKVPLAMDQEEVARITADYDLTAVPVVDEEGRFLGIITVDDIIDVIEDEASEDIAHFSGTHGDIDKLTDAPALTVVRSRMPWLVFALVGDGLFNSWLLKSYQRGLEDAIVVTLALFIPVIMTMGGNVGVQSSTLFVRRVATGELGDYGRYFLREIKIGLIMGGLVGAGVAGVAIVLINEPSIGVVVGAAMFCTMALASVTGVLIPKAFERLGIDPAISSSPFITTIQDILGLFIYFSLASLLLYRFF
ncbi:MAG: magnesium transporter [Euryarchaeota archaeon]|nr:magnesium transporter [Euryarchaeota archaeon]